MLHGTGEDANGGADGIAIGFRSHEMETDAVVAGKVVVAIEVSGAVVGSDQQVEVAVAIEVAIRKATTDFGTVELSASLGRDIAENSLAAVEKQLRRLCVSDIAANVANGLVDVSIGNGEVEPAVEVDIEKRAAEAEAVSGCDTDSRIGVRYLRSLCRSCDKGRSSRCRSS